jgi:hypothetical protein
MPHKRGPKTELGDTISMRPVTLSIDPLTERMLKAVGDGQLSRGVRKAARVAYALRHARLNLGGMATEQLEAAALAALARREPEAAPPLALPNDAHQA